MQKLTILRAGKHARPIDAYAHASQNAKAIIVICPGYRGSIDGYNNKYRVLAGHLASLGVAAIIQMSNIERQVSQYGPELVEDVKAVAEYAYYNASHFCATGTPDVYLMGFSAGGFAVASASSRYPWIKKVLLMEPSGNTELMGPFPVAALAKFRGEAYIVLGDHESVGLTTGNKFKQAFCNASKCEMVVVPNCDHQFTGTVNGQVMAKAPLWAFVGDTTFPSPEGGLVLY